MLKLKDNLLNPDLIDVFWDEELLASVLRKLFVKELEGLTSLRNREEWEVEFLALETKVAKREVVKLLARKGYLSDELRKKLSLKKLSSAAIEAAIAFAQKGGYVEDHLTLQRKIRSALRTGKGPQMLLYQLKQQGVSQELIEEARNVLSDQEKIALEEWLCKKYGRTAFSDRLERRKIVSQLLRRGFSSEAIFSTIGWN